MISRAVSITGIIHAVSAGKSENPGGGFQPPRRSSKIFLEEQNQIEIPERELVARRYPPPPWFSGIIELGENQKVIYGAQSVTAKILSAKNLDTRSWRCVPETGRISDVRRLATSAMMVHFECETQGQMSHGDVEKSPVSLRSIAARRKVTTGPEGR